MTYNFYMHMRDKILIVVLIASSLFFSGCEKVTQDVHSSRVVYIYDGDTVKLANGDKVRYLGIDTPEMNYKNPPAEHFAKAAKEFNESLVAGKVVRLQFDAQRRDKYNRLLAHVYVDDIHVNARMVEEGYAKVLVIPPNTKYADQFLKLQLMAKSEEKGIWSE